MKEPFIFLCSKVSEDSAFKLISWLQNEEITKYLSDTQDTAIEVRRVIERVKMPDLTHLFNQDGRFYIAYNKRKNPVGFVRLIVKESETEIVLVIGDSNNWGKKLGTSTLRESLKIAFFELRSQKVVANIDKENVRSVRVFKRVGFKSDYETKYTRKFSITIDEYIDLIKRAVIMPTDIFITEIDKARLKKIIEDQYYRDIRKDKTIGQLIEEINRAVIVDPKEVPFNVVTMNSRVLLHMNNEEHEISLVYPDRADWTNKQLSILSPVGTAILGYKEGDRFCWEIPSGIAEIQIKRVLYQPEAAGDYNL